MCSVENCNRFAESSKQQYCAMHRLRYKKYGDVNFSQRERNRILSDELILQIKQELARKVKQKDIAAKYKLNQTIISMINTGLAGKHIKLPDNTR